MKVLVIYDSLYGNTEQIVRAIGAACGSGEDVAVLRVGDVKPQQLAGLDMLVVGSPTQGFRPTPAIKNLIDSVPVSGLKGVKVAAFDTRMSPDDFDSTLGRTAGRFFMGTFGYAAKPVAEGLEKKAGELAVPPEGFFVEGKEGPLREGELERAADWARQLMGGTTVKLFFKKGYMIAALTIVVAVAFAVNFSVLGNNQNNDKANIKPASSETAPLNIGVSGYEVPYTVEQATKSAKDIAIGTVVDVQPSVWNTKDGKRPAGLQPDDPNLFRPDKDGNIVMIYTPVVVEVKKKLKGCDSNRIVIKILGGTVGDDKVVQAEQEALSLGDEVALFTDYTFTEANGDTLDVPLLVKKAKDGQVKWGLEKIALDDLEKKVTALKQ